MTDASNTRKQPVFSDIEDVVSIGALLRPTFVSAVKKLRNEQKETLFDLLFKAEQELARASVSYEKRFNAVKETLEKTYTFGPIWRFIAGRIEETWKEVEKPGVKELSTVTLLIGILYEETEAQLIALGKRRSA